MTVIDAEVVSESTEIVPVREGLVLPAAPLQEIKRAQDAYHALCLALLDAGDHQSIGDKSFVKKSGWRKLAVAYNVSCSLVSEELDHDEGHIVRAKYIVRATAPNGRYMDGVGLCDVSERSFGNKQDHDIPATAHTRATNRACADLFGLGEVSAEEVDSGTSHHDSHTTKSSGAGGPSEAQMRFLNRLVDDQGLSSADIIRDAKTAAKVDIKELSDLSVGAASKLIDYWKGGA